MRQRITFLQEPHNSLDPKSLNITGGFISASNVKAAREERVTFAFDELPQELYRVLKASRELHIRWISPNQYSSIAPLVSRLSPGLHVFYNPPLKKYDPLLCPMLKKVFGALDCLSPAESFTSLSMHESSPSATTQYYQPVDNLREFIEYTKHNICGSSEANCVERISSILQASWVDIDYNAESPGLTVTAFWSPQTQDIALKKTGPNDQLEVGILSVESSKKPEEITLGGFLTVVGEDTKPSPTLFTIPARHHSSGSTFSASFLVPTGLHPTLELEISSGKPPAGERSCALNAHMTLPRSIFPDKYQFLDPLFLASKNLSALHYITTPVDLEAPEYTTSSWGSSMLLELAPPPGLDQPWTANIPLHLRYLPPSAHMSGQSQLDVPYPVVFWSCDADEESNFSNNPFDRLNVGYENLFGPKTMFFHLTPNGDRLTNLISVPVLDLNQSKYVELGTAGSVLLGFSWVIWCLWRILRRHGYRKANLAGTQGKKAQ